MIMFGIKFTGNVPFKDIYITGLIKDGHGQKMSKSKGNVLDPIDLIDGISLEELLEKRTQGMMQPELASKIKQQTEKEFSNGIPPFGTDALRLTFTSLASFGRDIKFDLKRVEGYRNFCNKLWNASRFVLMKLESQSINFDATLSTPDKWILSSLQRTKIAVEKHLSDYRLDLMSQTLYEFVWHDYCDWYLELSKPLLDNKETRSGCEATLIKVLSETLTLLHPIIPFITEEIFEQCRSLNNDKSERLISKSYPEIDETLISKESESEVSWLQEFILGIRQIRGEMNISPGKPLTCFIQNLNTSDEAYIKNNLSIILTLAKLESIQQLSENDSAPESATALVGEMKILIPLAGIVDKEQEILRLNKEIDKLIKHQHQLSGKLNNKKFISKAPKAVVEKEQSKISSVEKALGDLELQLKKISSL
jgi:valyl-tRNA synthetase